MIYIYRILWLLFIVPMYVVATLLLIVGIPVSIIAYAIYYIKTGDLDDIPDVVIPFRATVMLIDWYNDLREKIENNNEKIDSYDY